MSKKIVLFVLLLLALACVKAFCNTEVITIYGNPSKEEQEASDAYFRERRAVNKAYIESQVKRQHEKEIEIQKFANALLLERASATQVTVNNTAVAKVDNDIRVRQKVEQSA